MATHASYKTFSGSLPVKKTHRNHHPGVINNNNNNNTTTTTRASEALATYERLRQDGVTPTTSLVLHLLKACTASRDVQTGSTIHHHLLHTTGGNLNIYVANTLLDMYSKSSRMDLARHSFESMNNHTVASWNTMILGYAQIGQGELGLELFTRMQEEGFVPDSRTFVAVLKACTVLAVKEPGARVCGRVVKPVSLEKGMSLHTQLSRLGYEGDVFVASTLVDMYSKCGSLKETRAVFDRMHHPDVVAWNAVITGHAQYGEAERAFEFFNSMQDRGFEPDARTYVAALNACSSLAVEREATVVLEKGRAVHRQLATRGHQRDNFVANALVDMYSKCGSVSEARSVFDRMESRDVVSWNSMIMGYVQCGEGESALELFTRMQDERLLTPDSRTFVAAVNACTSLAVKEQGGTVDGKVVKTLSLEKGIRVHSSVVRTEHELNIFVASSLVDMYSKCGSMVDARKVFDRMTHHDLVSWTAVVWGYAQSGDGDLALEFFSRMQEEGCVPDSRAFIAAVSACTSLAAKEESIVQVDGRLLKPRSLKLGAEVHSRLAREGYETDVFVANNLLDMYVKCGSVRDARSVFERMKNRDIVSWTSLIWGYSHNGEPEEALGLFRRVQTEEPHVRLNAAIFVAVLKACGSLPDLETGRSVHADVRTSGLETDSLVTNSLVGFYGRCGAMHEAQQVFDSASARSLITWNTLIAGYSHQGDSEKVFQLFERMRREPVQPDDITFVHILSLCSHAGLVEQGKLYFRMMESEFRLTPLLEHYTCMVDLLGRSNRLEEAVKLLKEMPLQADLTLWMTLLAASRKWRDVETGKLAFEEVVRLDDKDAGAYSLMASIYASVGRWSECLDVQRRRRKAKAFKSPGLSWWIDPSGRVHRFAAGDVKGHPQREVIVEKVRELTWRLKEEGYVPDVNGVVAWKASDEEKESVLCVHSERLALACALVNSEAGSVIRISKNLRICDDCHRAICVVSRVEERKVVCRDANRFHVFENGSCSCGDFW